MLLIQIVGPPGTLSGQVERQVNRVVSAHGLDCSVEKISDFKKIMALQVFAIPGVIVDGELKSVGRVPEVDELADWLKPCKNEGSGSA